MTGRKSSVAFDADAIRIEAVRAEDEYAGKRTILPTRCGTAPLRFVHSPAGRDLPFRTTLARDSSVFSVFLLPILDDAVGRPARERGPRAVRGDG